MACFAISAFGQTILSGLVVSRNDKKLIEGATVTIQEFTDDPIKMRELPVKTIKSDANGSWSASGLKPASYRLKITPPPVRSSEAGRRGLSIVSQTVEVPAGGKRDHVVELPLESTISGRVRDGEGKAVDLSFFVIATDEAQNIVSGTGVDAASFIIGNLSKGNFQFDLTNEGGYYLERILLGKRDIGLSAIEVGDGADVSDVTLVVSNVKGTVKGRVMGLRDGEFRLIVLVPYRESAKTALRASNPEATDETGAFEINDKPGEYFAAVIDMATLQKRTPDNADEWLAEITRDAQRIVIKANETTSVEFRVKK